MESQPVSRGKTLAVRLDFPLNWIPDAPAGGHRGVIDGTVRCEGDAVRELDRAAVNDLTVRDKNLLFLSVG